MAGLRRVLFDFEVLNFWDIPHRRTRTKADCRNEDAWADWLFYKGVRERWDEVEGISWPKRVTPLRGDAREHWAADNISILSPTRELVAECDKADVYNDASYVLMFRHATSRVLLASDIEERAWLDIIDAGINLQAHVLIASHHGRKSGYCDEAMQHIRPNAVIISTGKPASKDDAIGDYRRHTQHVFSTRVDGDTQITMWDDGDLDICDAEGTRLARFVD